ncbi:trace amine-associated receptor 1-like [Nothobranchius furzeri]|uniref:Trace amine-associated receptor 1-like n=1 Tax=Nothobranchius furzeri TaxID=105023 RepID=A0A9D2Z2U6_NOTFU|nr:trace amine-associated receptor 1-like [Nothobranchius furzeri]
MLYGLLTLLSLVTVCGNLLVIISVFYFKQLHTPTNSLILSLAVADLLVGILVFPFSMAFSLSSCMYHDSLFCKVRNSFVILLSSCSILHLCCISIDRYYAVCQPLTYKSKISHRVVVIMITVSWGVSELIGIVMVIPRSNENCGDTCDIVANAVGPLFSYYLPLVIIPCMYLKIFLVARKQACSIQTRMKGGATVSKMERKSTKTLAIVLGGFLLCWTPFFLCFSFIPLTHNPAPLPVLETLNWLALSNSMLNPFIYAFFYSWFRSAFKIIISGKIFQSEETQSQVTAEERVFLYYTDDRRPTWGPKSFSPRCLYSSARTQAVSALGYPLAVRKKIPNPAPSPTSPLRLLCLLRHISDLLAPILIRSRPRLLDYRVCSTASLIFWLRSLSVPDFAFLDFPIGQFPPQTSW